MLKHGKEHQERKMKKISVALTVAVLLSGAVALHTTAFGQDHVPVRDGVANAIGRVEYSPYAGRSYPTKVLWGDTHLHTAISVDAGTMCRLGQEEAFRFARGEEVVSTHGQRVKLSRPLDYIVVCERWPTNTTSRGVSRR
jgi:hypothetical protein